VADFDVVKISLLPPTENVGKDDLLVIDKLQPSNQYTTNSITIGLLVDFITRSDLNFTGDVTFIGTIQAPPDYTLDGIFDRITIRESITLEEGAEVSGLYLNDLDDVVIDLPEVGDAIVYVGEGIFRNQSIDGDYVKEAPNNGRTYARKNNEWTDITDCIRCPGENTDTIGDVSIIKLTTGDVFVGDPVRFSATIGGDATDVSYSWSVSPETAIIANDRGLNFTIDVRPLIDYVAKVISGQNSSQNVSSYEPYINDTATLLDPSVDFSKIKEETLYSWSTAANNSSIIIRTDKTITVSLTRIINYITNWVGSFVQEYGVLTGEYFSVNIDESVRQLYVTKNSSIGQSTEVPRPYDLTETDTYSWEVRPTMASIRNINSDLVSITFQYPLDYAVTCQVNSSVAIDSPRTGAISVTIEDTFRLLTDPNNQLIMTEANEYVIYDR
jgi:hypothetical protein